MKSLLFSLNTCCCSPRNGCSGSVSSSPRGEPGSFRPSADRLLSSLLLRPDRAAVPDTGNKLLLLLLAGLPAVPAGRMSRAGAACCSAGRALKSGCSSTAGKSVSANEASWCLPNTEPLADSVAPPTTSFNSSRLTPSTASALPRSSSCNIRHNTGRGSQVSQQHVKHLLTRESRQEGSRIGGSIQQLLNAHQKSILCAPFPMLSFYALSPGPVCMVPLSSQTPPGHTQVEGQQHQHQQHYHHQQQSGGHSSYPAAPAAQGG